MNSACLAQGSASMWAARGRIARTRHASTLQYRHPDWETVSSLKDSSQLTRSVFVNAV